jgi:small subunit ribosomal protein S1
VVVEASANQEETEKVETTETTEGIEETKTENAPVEAVLETKEEEPVAETPVVEEEKVETKTEKEKPSVDKSKLLEEFDWNAHVSDEDQYSSDERNELKGIYEKTLSTISESETVDGKVVAMTKREIVVNIGYKSEGIINLNEFRYNPELQVGDKVEVYVDSLEDKSGQLILSHKKARAIHSWDRVNKALEDSEIIKGFIKCRTKGGMIVDVFGIEAFLPVVSQPLLIDQHISSATYIVCG